MPGNACGGSEEEAGQQCFRATATALLDQLVQSFPESASALWSDMQSFTVPHDWEKRPMSAWIAWGVLAVNITTWWFYYYERAVINRKHMKFRGSYKSKVLLVHILAGVAETLCGFASVINPSDVILAKTTAYIALLFHIPTNLILSPQVWGLRYITVTGYVVVGLLRAFTAMRVLFSSHYLVADLWILLQMATLVRIIVYFVTPWSSVNGKHAGDLSTEPFIHTLAIGTASLVSTAFVYPPWMLVVVLNILALMKVIFPPRIAVGPDNSVRVLHNDS